MLPQSADLPPLRRVVAQVVHTTGDGLTAALVERVGDDLAKLEAEAVAWLERTAHTEYAHTLIGPAGGVYELAPETVQAWHSRSLDGRYHTHAWRSMARPLGEGWQYHGRPAARVWDWWDARWHPHGIRSPIDLPPGQRPNACTLAIDLLPLPGGGYSALQVQVAYEVLRERARRHSLPFDRLHVLGHEDIDPLRRGVVRRGDDILGVPWDPGPKFWKVVGL